MLPGSQSKILDGCPHLRGYWLSMSYHYRGVTGFLVLKACSTGAARLTLNSSNPVVSSSRARQKLDVTTDPFGSYPLLADAHRQSATLARAFWDGSYRSIRFVAHLTCSLNYLEDRNVFGTEQVGLCLGQSLQPCR